ncbi:hypothetical protein EMIHUDRAFT_212772 [Emiliania huxleyi CCMP1516]|uniref:Uncharacterized protein n=2 Tax=Emiliania huxleyi TaxID=2903 RepID=A0A0D3IP89_EMIH1|nr:hypothetical protein EMIHUDRAFT_212772 [Emiliania huxleyi CCMP1516]EOD13074.1 hypothetical protein EMIHUDRAFT_212772 [Emiliania huxleyi CCMP1516]|eukprot:XP_005765503.1 hypothetical protein EMIHUDRAFT_212772 [Emiliania huxleyi CCMP1516]
MRTSLPAYEPESLAIMEQVFGMDHFPSRPMRSSIAVALSITPRQDDSFVPFRMMVILV